MIIVDNSILSFAFDLDNGVPINSFMGNEEDDKELLFLYSFLEEAAGAEDVRANIRDSFKLSYLQSTILNVKQSWMLQRRNCATLQMVMRTLLC